MKTLQKTLAVVLIATAGLALANEASIGREVTRVAVVGALTSSTNYYGSAKTTAGTTAPTTNAAVWKIVRVVVDANGAVTSQKNAYGSGDDVLWSTAYSNHVSATYK